MDNPGAILKQLHRESGISQAHVCNKLKIDTGNYCRMLQADNMMYSSFLQACNVLGYTLEIKKNESCGEEND